MKHLRTVISALAISCTVCITAVAAEKTVIFVPTTEASHGRDMAYLAAIPAGSVQNSSGKPAVISLDEFGRLTPEVEDYLQRYQPDHIYWLTPVEKRSPLPIIGHYKLDETNGRRAEDSSRGAHHATFERIDLATHSIAGAQGRGVTIEGSQRRLCFPDDSEFHFASHFTICFWMKSHDVAQAGPYLLNRFPKGAAQHGLLYRKGQIETQGGTGGKIAVTDQQWHHYVFVNDGKSWKGYRDGTLEFDEPGFQWNMENPAPWLVNQFGALNIALDDIRFYPQSLNDDQVQEVLAGKVLWTNESIEPPRGAQVIDVASAEAAANEFARRFWKTSKLVVLCEQSDYASALSAAALAARLSAPLLFFDAANGLSPETRQAIDRLGAQRSLLVGRPLGLKTSLPVTPLADSLAVLHWMSENGLPVDYLAMANPHDREKTWMACGKGPIDIKKISLAAPLLAAGRQGGVLLFDEPNVLFKRQFQFTEEVKEPVAGVRPGAFRYGVDYSAPYIGQLFKLDETGPQLADGFSEPHFPVGEGHAHALLMSHATTPWKAGGIRPSEFAKVWLFASQADAKQYDRIGIDLNRDEKFADSEIFRSGDPFELKTYSQGVRKYVVEEIGGNGVGFDDKTVHFTVGYKNWFVGEISLGAKQHRFAMVPSMHVPHWNVYSYTEAVIDLDGDGDLGDEATTWKSGDEFVLDGRTYDLSLFSSMESPAHTDRSAMYLTYPSRSQASLRVREASQVLGRHPDLLCIVALPSAIPLGVASTGLPEPADILGDLHFGQADDDPFLEIGVGRFFSENHAFTTLAAARCLTYEDLIDPTWAHQAVSLGWAPRGLNTMLQMKNFGMDYRLIDTGQYLTDPGKRHENLKNVSLIWHAQHSDGTGLGAGPNWSMKTLVPPAVLTSGGCMVVAIDWAPPPHNATARWLRKGGVAILGGTRQNGAQHARYDYTFWNKVLAGQSLGQAFRTAINYNRDYEAHAPENSNTASYENFALIGDPGLKVHRPEPPRIKPAYVSAQGDLVTAHAPESNWSVREIVETSRESRIDYRCGPGLVPRWPMIEGFLFKAEYRAPGRVVDFKKTDGSEVQYTVDAHQDGTTSIYWTVDFEATQAKEVAYKVRLAPSSN